MRPKTKRAWLVALGVLCFGGGLSIILTVFNDQLVFFYTPTQAQEGVVPADKIVRIGGLVAAGSVREKEGTLDLSFALTDGEKTVEVFYQGIRPPMFREGQGMVAEGTLTQRDGAPVFQAQRLLTKHDENYMPPEVARSLKDKGHWKETMSGDGDYTDSNEPSPLPSGEGVRGRVQ